MASVSNAPRLRPARIRKGTTMSESKTTTEAAGSLDVLVRKGNLEDARSNN
jgi:hypothetical protein